MRTSREWWPRGTVARGKGMQARGIRAVAQSCPRNRGVSMGDCEYRCCACLTPSQQTEAGVHSGVCASAKVKRWHGKATFVPCKHNPAPLQLCQAACVCMCVHVRVCACVRARVCACVSLRTRTNRLQSGLCTIPRGIKCPPALLPRPLPRTPLLLLMPVARNAGGALCWEERFAERGGGQTGVNQLQARASRSSTAHPPPLLRAPLSQERQHKQTRHQITHAGSGKKHSAAPAGGGRNA